MTPYEAKAILDKAMRIRNRGADLFSDKRFGEQNRFVLDPSRFITAQCSRRAGKTNGLALRFFRTLHVHNNCFCPYIALTRESARNILWPILQEIDDRYKLGCVFTESNLTMTYPNGSRLQLFGADMKNFIRRLKGIKTPGAAIDEAQDFGDHLQTLVDDVLTPTLTDYQDSWLAIVGTPGPIPRGYFYEITKERRYGFSFHAWTLFNNPYLPNAQSFLDDLKIKREWDEQHPTLQREWLNNWVLDTESLLIKYDEEKSHYDLLPSHTQWNYILGVDIGFNDADALAVLAWTESSPYIYLVEEVVTTGQDITQLVNCITKLSSAYDIAKIVMDEGALGKKIAEEMRRRFHVPVHAADKARKMENVALLNDYLRLGKFKANKRSRFVKDTYQVQIDWETSTPDRLKVKPGYHSDIIDAVLYAFKESPAFTYRAPVIKPVYGTKEWMAEEAQAMEDRALEYFTALEEAEKGYGMDTEFSFKR